MRKVGKAAIAISIAASSCRSSAASRSASSCPQTCSASRAIGGGVRFPRLRAVDFLVKIVAGVVREMNFMRARRPNLVATAVIDDTIGWVIIAVIVSLAARGHLT